MDLKAKILDIVSREVKPALGCTEPISSAFAAALLREHLGAIPEQITLQVSGNLMKNAIAVTIPNTQESGLPIAAALGCVCGDSALGLEVLRHLEPSHIAQAKALLPRISISIAENVPNLYIHAKATYGTDEVRVIIEGEHTYIRLLEKNKQILIQNPPKQDDNSLGIFDTLSLREVYDLACQIEEDKIAFIAESARLNAELSREGLKRPYGLGIGYTFKKHLDSNLLQNDLGTQILIQTTAASDARMGGAPLPAMSNSGSGNQGITATMPVVVVAKHLKKEHELNRALFLSHLVAIYIHSKLPRLSALCAVTTAGIGSYAGIAWLFSKDFEVVSMGICNMIGDISGVLCDGAGSSCSMKVSTTIQSAFKALLLALDKSRVGGKEGIVDNEVDKSIQNLCDIASKSMQLTDKQILEIMLAKTPVNK